MGENKFVSWSSSLTKPFLKKSSQADKLCCLQIIKAKDFEIKVNKYNVNGMKGHGLKEIKQ